MTVKMSLDEKLATGQGQEASKGEKKAPYRLHEASRMNGQRASEHFESTG